MKIASEINIINSKIEDIVAKITAKQVEGFYSKKFNTKNLKEYQGVNKYSPNMDTDFRYLFEELDQKENHCLYWFELESKNKAIELNNLMNNYRFKKGSPNYRTVPATNKNEESNILYVGIGRGKQKPSNLSNIVGRINQHMGYYKVARTQGLQLVHYAKGLDFDYLKCCRI